VEPSGADSPRGVERLVLFSDAVIAIAVTLIVLPLVDAARELGDTPVQEFLEENGLSFLAAAVSFVAISLFWLSHHRTFADVDRCPPALLRVNLVWLAAIAVLPVTTTLNVNTGGVDRLALSLYLLNLSVVWACGQFLQVLVRRVGPPRTVSARERFWEWSPLAILVLTLLGTATLGRNGLWALFLLPVSARLQARTRGA
jgi:uncharacterized membrane protein